jgi:uncharacterized phage protein gp47/JayE
MTTLHRTVTAVTVLGVTQVAMIGMIGTAATADTEVTRATVAAIMGIKVVIVKAAIHPTGGGGRGQGMNRISILTRMPVRVNQAAVGMNLRCHRLDPEVGIEEFT